MTYNLHKAETELYKLLHNMSSYKS